MCSTEANLEVIEVLMFLAGSYSEIWGCLFYSVNILNARWLFKSTKYDYVRF